MRIISGKYKGKHIPVPSSFKARPTTDFAREGLFNILANTWEFGGLTVLDLFAGTGSIGFEFASRGASKVDMVEADARSSRFLQRTADTLAADNVRVLVSGETGLAAAGAGFGAGRDGAALVVRCCGERC